jgi:hypothetical protein
MHTVALGSIAGDFCELFRQQMEALAGRKFKDFAKEELAAYRNRKRKIQELRAELEKLVRSMPATAPG